MLVVFELGLLLGVVKRAIFHLHRTFANMRSSINCPMAVWKQPCEAWLAENRTLSDIQCAVGSQLLAST